MSFIHQETKYGKLVTYTEHGNNRKTYGYRSWNEELNDEIQMKAESKLVFDKLAEKHPELKND